MKKRKLIPATELYRLRSEGWSITRLGRHFGVTTPAIYMHLKRNAPELLAVKPTAKIFAHGPCEICGVESRLDADHCHVTNQQRGLLCRGCNQGLGNFTDSAEKLTAALAYLKKYSA